MLSTVISRRPLIKSPHKRLISKLYSYNIGEGIIKWIVDFLKLENTESELMALTQVGMMSLVESHKAVFWDQFCF